MVQGRPPPSSTHPAGQPALDRRRGAVRRHRGRRRAPHRCAQRGLRDASGGVWCDPPGRAPGERPGATSDGAHVANLRVKTVGLSAGTCNGRPAAGTHWEEYLLELAANAPW